MKRAGLSNLTRSATSKPPPEIIRLAVMLYVSFPLSLPNVEDFVHERGGVANSAYTKGGCGPIQLKTPISENRDFPVNIHGLRKSDWIVHQM